MRIYDLNIPRSSILSLQLPVHRCRSWFDWIVHGLLYLSAGMIEYGVRVSAEVEYLVRWANVYLESHICTYVHILLQLGDSEANSHEMCC